MQLTDPIYRALGIVASVNRRLWLIRVNFIPLNVALMVVLAAGVVAGYDQLTDAASNDERPVPQTLAVLLSSGTPVQSYVQVQGTLFADAPLQYGTEGKDGELKTVERSWAPLFDAGTGNALMVELAPGRGGSEPADVAITGMLRPLPSHLHTHLAETNFKHRGVTVESRFMLVEGEQPAALASGALIGAGCALLLLGFAAAMFCRNVVFRAEAASAGNPLASLPSDEPLLVSGRLFLNDKVSQHFANMPAAVGTLDTGETAIVSNIDASSRFMGVKTQDRAGLWTMTFRPGTVHDAQTGHVFDGMRKRRALRFRYMNDATGRQECAVIAMA